MKWQLVQKNEVNTPLKKGKKKKKPSPNIKSKLKMTMGKKE